MSGKTSTCPIAVIGLACWYPGARNPLQLWENILSRRRNFRQIPNQRLPIADYYHPDPDEPDKTYAKQAAVIDGFDFDWASLRIPYSTFKTADISHWLSLYTAIEAIKDAGYSRENIPGEHTGVIMGNTLTGEQSRANTMRLRWPYFRRAFLAATQSKGFSRAQLMGIETELEIYFKSVFPETNEDSLAGGLSNTIAGRICNFLNLSGGGYVVDGACSSSLLAISTAATGLVNGDLNLALAGGVDISLDSFELIGFAKTRALALNEMTVYDRRGSGFIPGEGCGFVVLKRLEDAKNDGDYIYSVLQGWGISSDGSGTSLTAPKAEGQSKALIKAYDRAPYDIHSLHFIEGHGTGTSAGDQAELEGIAIAMEKDSDASSTSVSNANQRLCGISSLKSLIGHTKAASGIGGFIKAVLAVNRRIIPPTAACQYPHPVFDTSACALYPVLYGEIHDPEKKLRAGVSAMGFGGINCHVTIESADPPSIKFKTAIKERVLLVSNQETELFVLTAGSIKELENKVENLKKIANGISIAELSDLASKLGNEALANAGIRAAIIAAQPDELLKRLEELSILAASPPPKNKMLHDSEDTIFLSNQLESKKIGVIFPGQGSQKLNMARVLVERFQWAKDIVDMADTHTVEMGGTPISHLLYRPLDKAVDAAQIDDWFSLLSQTENAQPAICLASLLWFIFLKDLGISPVAAGGHSLGELSAFFAAGAYDADELLRFAALRGKAMAARDENSGTMVSLICSPFESESIMAEVEDYLVLANINGPSQVVLSGEKSAVESAIAAASKKGIKTYRLNVSNAFHSKLAAKAFDILKSDSSIPLNLPPTKLKLFSSVNGQEIKEGLSLRDHFADQVLARVDFISMVKSMAGMCDLFVEVGPGRVLSNLVNEITGPDGPVCFPVESLPHNNQDLNRLLGILFTHGIDIHWNNLYKGRLIRPFTPVSQKKFIVNPCEKPFKKINSDSQDLNPYTMENLENFISEQIKLSKTEIDEYLKTRGNFLADIIRADLKYLPKKIFMGSSSAETSVEKKDSVTLPKSANEHDIQSILFSIVEKITGFPSNSLSLDMRILDDLNLDSIKAGDLVAKTAIAMGVEDRIEPLNLAGATLAEIVKALETTSDTDLSVPDTLEILKKFIAQATGLSSNTIDVDTIIEQGLNISDKMVIGKVIQETALQLNLEVSLDLAPLLKRSLRQIAAIIDRIAQNQAGIKFPMTREESEWVREFKVELVEEAFHPLPEHKMMRREGNWQFSNILILGSSDSNELLESFKNIFSKLNAQVKAASYRDAHKNQLIKDPVYSHFIVILPKTSNSSNVNQAELQNIIKRLASITSPPPASAYPRRRTTVAYIQFGGGYFGNHPHFCNFGQCCACALSASLHLERSDLRVRLIDFSSTINSRIIAKKTIKEINSPASYTAVGYDYKLKRRIAKYQLIQPAFYKPRPHIWSTDDVILVSGGARGITALCALALADKTGVRMALVGRSPHPDTNPDALASREVVQTLKKYSGRGLIAQYFACDISDADSVLSTVNYIQKKMGTITGVIHGAGLNIPRKTAQVSDEMALVEISPKVMGALNIISAVKTDTLKMFVGFCSIIGVAGMPGNAWYGFSNEALNIILQRLAIDHPNISTLSIAYSIWKDEGMGARMGSVSHLEKQGTYAIPSHEGIKRFVHLFFNDPGIHQVIVAARMGEMDTWQPRALAEPPKGRYLEKLLQTTPGVESIFKVHLSLALDPYLKDHLFNGSYLFPTVFGLEAMAQVAAHALGEIFKGRVRIEDIKLERPITVDSETGANIIIWAEVKEFQKGSNIRVIQAGISKLQTGIRSDFFSATFISGFPEESSKYSIPVSKQSLAIDPKLDLYNERLLFQGPLFHRIHKINSIPTIGKHSQRAVFYTHLKNTDQIIMSAFPYSSNRNLMLGDPFFRDSLLQSALLLVPEKRCLPVYIKQLEIYPLPVKNLEKSSISILAAVDLTQHKMQVIEYNVMAVDQNGALVEKLTGYTLRILKDNIDNPTAAELACPDDRDNNMVNKVLGGFCDSLELERPAICLKYIPGIHALSKNERHQKELPLIQKTLNQRADKNSSRSNLFEIRWLASGRPVVKGVPESRIAFSLSHDERLCLCIAGAGRQGCDIAPVTPTRTRQEWTGLLGKSRINLLDELIDDSCSLDQAGTRIWSAMETLRKIEGKSNAFLEINKKDGDAVLFQVKSTNRFIHLLSVKLNLTWGPERILTIAAPKIRPSEEDVLSAEAALTGYEDLLDMDHIGMSIDGPQDQGVFIQRFYVGFKPNAQLSRTVYFSNYPCWLGEVREASVWPVLGTVGEQFAKGKYGQVTNNTHLQILGEATAKDRIEIKLWASDNRGPANSTMELTYDVRKILQGGGYERLAKCIQNTTWVKVIEYGVVKPEPYPEYYQKFMDSPHVLLLPQNNASSSFEPLVEPLRDLGQNKDDKEEYSAPEAPVIQPVLHEQVIQTSLDNSNLVGNVYFANYFSWQGQTRDQYFYNLIPEYFRGTEVKSELLCLESRVDHLREAMPFDKIIVSMALKKLKTFSAVFYFEYFRLEADGKRTKIAFGEQAAIWVTRDSQGKPVPAPFPLKIKKDFYKLINA
ncbi:MAG: SDR family NAD(P)-dependent oxidoreductase [Deltaproteobacteria bacterium]|nr:SDR family NAD(P)-dependent oxidoreductase [Deltaproteobacteria bacterium]